MSRPIALIGALAILAVACGGDEEQPVGSETTVTTVQVTPLVTSPTVAATETSIAAPTTVADASDPGGSSADETSDTSATTSTPSTTAPPGASGEDLSSDFAATLRAVGSVRLGMSVEEAIEASTLDLTQDFGRASKDNCFFVAAGTRLPGVSFMVVDGEIVRIELNPPSAIATRSGVRIGTSRESLTTVYANNIQPAPEGVSEGEALAFVPNDEEDADYRIYFTIENGEVSSFRVGTLPAIDNLSGCAA